MAIKKFSAYINEGTGTSAASNFVAPKDSDEEVTKYKPRSKGEEDFANAHTVTKHDYPVDVEAQFSGGNTQKPRQPNNGEKNVKQGSTDVNQPKGGGDSRRGADKKQGDMKPVNPVKEEVELDESDEAKFYIWHKKSQELDKMRKDAYAKLQKFPKGEMGLVPDSVRKTPEYKKAESQANAIHQAIRKHNRGVPKKWFKMGSIIRRKRMMKESVELDELKKYDKNADFRLLNKLSQKEKSGKLTSAEKQQMANAKARLRNHGAMKEDLELFEGKVLDALQDIVKEKSAKKVKFANGKSTRIDMTTANAMLNLHKKLNPQNKKKMEDAIEKSPEMLMRLMDVAFKG